MRDFRLPPAVQLKSSLFYSVTQRTLVVAYRRFGITYRFIIQGSSKPNRSSIYYFFSFVVLRPNEGHGLPILEVSGSHTTTQHSRQDSSGRVISSSQRPLPDNTQHLQQTNIHAPRWDSNPRSQQANDRRPMPQTARPLGPAVFIITVQKHSININNQIKLSG